jgi:hypothetical protein
MKERFLGIVSAVAVLLVTTITVVATTHDRNLESTNLNSPVSTEVSDTTEKVRPICDGMATTNNCAVDGINYSTYVYHPPVAEKSHTESVTTYKQEVSGYCTLCVDGTYSPSCATGRGACSHHGGVAQWSAPRYSNVPVSETKTVVDAPAKEAYYEKSAE